MLATAFATSEALPENVNYAVKSSFLLSFLESVPEVAGKVKDPVVKERQFEEMVTIGRGRHRARARLLSGTSFESFAYDTTERLRRVEGTYCEHERHTRFSGRGDSLIRCSSSCSAAQFLSSTLHSNAMEAADILAQPNFSSDMYERMEGRILLLLRQGITELEHGLTPPEPVSDNAITLTDEHGVWWFFWHCSSKTRTWLIMTAVSILRLSPQQPILQAATISSIN